MKCEACGKVTDRRVPLYFLGLVCYECFDAWFSWIEENWARLNNLADEVRVQLTAKAVLRRKDHGKLQVKR